VRAWGWRGKPFHPHAPHSNRVGDRQGRGSSAIPSGAFQSAHLGKGVVSASSSSSNSYSSSVVKAFEYEYDDEYEDDSGRRLGGMTND